MGVSYDGTNSELIHESGTGLWTAGKRCPDLDLKPPGLDQPKRLYSMVEYGQYLVLSVGARQQEGDRARFKDLCKYLTLLPGGTLQTDAAETGVFVSDHVAADDRLVVVVRPDMYIGYVGEGEGEGWKGHMAEVFNL